MSHARRDARHLMYDAWCMLHQGQDRSLKVGIGGIMLVLLHHEGRYCCPLTMRSHLAMAQWCDTQRVKVVAIQTLNRWIQGHTLAPQLGSYSGHTQNGPVSS